MSERFDAAAQAISDGIDRRDASIAKLTEALTDIASTCRGSGPMARDHDADTLRMIGLYAEAIVKNI